MKFKDLYEQYKNGDKQAYEEALKLVIEEAERKGYSVKVYHGTGADGFNVADAWRYLVNESQFVSILEKIYEYIEKHYKSSSIRTNQSNPLTVITNGLREINGIFVYRNVSFGRIVPEGISRRDKQSDERNQRGVERQGKGEQSRLKSLQRQDRSENPVYWASIVLAKEILRGRKINGAMLEKVLPSDKFDGTKRQYAIDRAKLIAEQCKATQEDYAKRLDEAVQLAEVDVGFDENEVFERFNESSPYWNTRRGQSFTQSIQRRLSNNEMSEIDLNLNLVSKYQRESQDKNLE